MQSYVYQDFFFMQVVFWCSDKSISVAVSCLTLGCQKAPQNVYNQVAGVWNLSLVEKTVMSPQFSSMLC